ncbi:MAG: hypothetical protein HC906_00160 [Bacteroidales bacterium]|nr:hypothetical protein [Bacteroidales bacterium]
MVARDIPGIYNNPVLGWISGIHLNDIGKVLPKVINGKTGRAEENKIAVLHVALHKGKFAKLEILNIFEQGNGHILKFEKDGFNCTDCLINGKKQKLSDYLISNSVDTRLPLVADYSGANINISFQNVDRVKGEVTFYAPVLKNTEYKLAKPIQNYVQQFNSLLKNDVLKEEEILFSCNCILNYLYSELDGKKTGSIKGPFTFGEIAYVLVNQTMVYLSIV